MKKMYAKDYRMLADQKCNLFNNKLIVIYLIYILLLGAINSISSGIASLIITGPATLSLIIISKKTYEGIEAQYEDLFEGFKDFGDTFVLYLLQSIYVILWSLLFIIPGIIKSYSYSMAMYIYNDNKNLSADAAITESKKLMNGHKWEFFCLNFSYIGWLLLSVLTCGLLTIWITPRMEVAKYAFYLHITGKDIKIPQEKKSEPDYDLSTIEPVKNVDELV